jgi:hypothetical protein
MNHYTIPPFCVDALTMHSYYWCTASLKWSITTWGGVLLENLRVTHLLKNFPAFYETQRFVTVFTTARHWSLSWVRRIHSTTSQPISLTSILILSSHLRLGLSSVLFPSGYPTEILYAFHIVSMRATCAAHLPPPPDLTIWHHKTSS